MHNKINNLYCWIKNSFIDYPGKISCVLFFAGCNLRCPYCYNHKAVLQQDAIDEKPEEVYYFLNKRKNDIYGVVLSGGEPTLNKDIVDITKHIRSFGYKIKLDTNGLLPDVIHNVSPDYLALDIKTIPSKYKELLYSYYNDIDDRILEAISIVKAMKNNAEIRITVAPKLINDSIIKKLCILIEGVSTVWLQDVKLSYSILNPKYFEGLKTHSINDIKRFQTIISKHVTYCGIR